MNTKGNVPLWANNYIAGDQPNALTSLLNVLQTEYGATGSDRTRVANKDCSFEGIHYRIDALSFLIFVKQSDG
jgi:hypothetical protein